jgi:hypothetical protein
MGGSLPGPAARRILFGTCLAILFVMWLLTFQSVMNSIGLSHGDVLDTGPAGIVLWLCKELAWWWTVGTLMAILIGFGLNSETFLDLKAMVSRQDGRLRNQSPGE